MSELVTDADLARARVDPLFRQQFLADHLDRLLEALNKARGSSNHSPRHAKQIREGVELAVKLADRLNGPSNPGPKAA